jgi:heme oxygenase
MSNLKELTWEHHQNAERQDFVKVLMSGSINPKLYATYLWNQHKKYDLLEAMAAVNGIWLDIPYPIQRKMAIEQDFLELWEDKENPPEIVPSTHEYIEHMRSIMSDREKVMAHIYVLHMGDLSGGQMISKKVPGEGRMYQFDGDITAIKDAIKSHTSDDMADEAKYVFDSATQLFKELMELDIEHYLESSDPVSE